MDLKEYAAIITEWKKQYGVPAFSYDPTAVSTCCKKCGKMKPQMARHHRANDFFFALWFPKWYAARYIQYHRDDCDKLCSDCHDKCHKYFYRMAQEMYTVFANEKVTHPFTDEVFWRTFCTDWKAAFLALYTKWITQPPHKRKRRRKRRSAAKREE